MGYYDDWLPRDWRNASSDHSICWIVVAAQPDFYNEYWAFAQIFWQNIAISCGLLLVYCLLCTSVPNHFKSLVTRTGTGQRSQVNRRSVRFEKKPFSFRQTFINLGNALEQKLLIPTCEALDFSKLSHDAIHYLAFQRSLITLLAIDTLASLLILFPTLFFLGNNHDIYDMKSLSLANVEADSPWICIPIAVAFAQLPLTLWVMKRYVDQMSGVYQVCGRNPKCLELTRLPKDMREKDGIRQWLASRYPWAAVESVTLTFNTKRLWQLVQQEREVLRILAECRPGDTLFFSNWYCACTDAEEHYSNLLPLLRERIRRENILCLENPLDTAFVLMRRRKEARAVVIFEAANAQTTFKTSLATDVSDIRWQNLQRSDWLFWKRVVTNIAFVLVTYGLTTPEHIAEVAMLVFPSNLQNTTARIYMMVLVLGAASKVCSWLMQFGIEFLGYWKKSVINEIIFRELTVYILFTILLLPTLGFVSVYQFLGFLAKLITATVSYDEMNAKVTPQWYCIFLPQGGRFYATYMITTALTGNVLSLFRLEDKLAFVGKIVTVRSLPELRSRLRQGLPPVHTCWFGKEYAQLVLHLYIAVCLMTAFPVLTPIGLMYFVAKHLVDLFNFKQERCAPTKINRDHLATSVSYTVGSSVALQFYTFLYVVNSSEELHKKSEVTGLLAITSLTFLLVQVFSDWRWPLKLLSDKRPPTQPEQESQQSADSKFWPPYHNDLPLIIRMGTET